MFEQNFPSKVINTSLVEKHSQCRLMLCAREPKHAGEGRGGKAVIPIIMAAIFNNSICKSMWMRLSGCRSHGSALFCLSLAMLCSSLAACVSVPEKRKDLGVPVVLPFMRMDGAECYYLDDFMPTPDNMVSGKSSGLYLRYYTFRSATYKTWEQERVMLAFFSRDNRCWSLFEEYSTSRL